MNPDAIRLPPFFHERPLRVALAGCGGTGSQMLSGLARLDRCLRAVGHPGLHVVAYDPDRVSEANVGRQLFAPAEVGRFKAAVLTTRVNAWFGLPWKDAPLAYAPGSRLEPHDVVIGCVDTARARLGIAQAAAEAGAAYWIDCGNDARSGQVVWGEPPRRGAHLPNALDLFPEIATATDSLDRNTGPSCSLAQAVEQQSPFVNQAVATLALDALWAALRRGTVEHFAWFVNLDAGSVRALAADPPTIARFRPTAPA